jgi:hypothetical protein
MMADCRMNDPISRTDNLSGAPEKESTEFDSHMDSSRTRKVGKRKVMPNSSGKPEVEEATDRELAIYSLRYAPKGWWDDEE